MDHRSRLLQLIQDKAGLISTAEVAKLNIPTIYLTLFTQADLLERVGRGMYLAKDAFDDEMYRMQLRYGRGVLSHGTALFLHDLTDRTPNRFTMTFPNSYHSSSLKTSGLRVFYVAKSNHQAGVITKLTQYGRKIITYDVERTIVDLFRSRNWLDPDPIRIAVKEYLERDDRNISLLMKYARMFRMERIINEKIEMML